MKEKKTFKVTWPWIKEGFKAGWYFYSFLIFVSLVITLIACGPVPQGERLYVIIWIPAPLLVILLSFITEIYEERYYMENYGDEEDGEEEEP